MICLWWIGEGAVDGKAMEHTRLHVERVFGPAVLHHGAARPPDSLDPGRGQHSSTRILQWLAGARPPGATKAVAVTDVDLFIPVLTFVFGEAQLGGAAAVVSTARLQPPPGTRGAAALAVERLVKECVHELGHAFGLVHCAELSCVMSRSVNLPGVDAKKTVPCRDCRLRLDELRRGLPVQGSGR